MKTLSIAIPDWSQLESELAITTPFWRWNVVDQPLIDHWIDHARDGQYKRLEILTDGDPAPLEKHLSELSFFAGEWQVRHATGTHNSNTQQISDLPEYTPGYAPLIDEPGTGWELVNHHHQLERMRLTQLWDHDGSGPPSVCIGRFARIHPSASIEGPFWIGDNTRIGRNAQIGPFTIIGANCVIARGASLRSTSVTDHTVIGAFTDFGGHVVSGAEVLNRNERIRLESTDPSIARSDSSRSLVRSLLAKVR